MAYKTAHFKTAYLQHELVMDAKLSENVKVGALVTYTASTNTFAGAQTVAAATHIIAQSDVTLEYGHVPVENRDYRYSDAVAASTTATKRLALFKIINPDDVVLDN